MRSKKARDGGPLSTLGEDLKHKNPAMARKIAELQETRPAASPKTGGTPELDTADLRLADTLKNMFPFPWRDPKTFKEGILLCIQNRNREAAAVFEKALREDPRAYPAQHLLGFVRGSLGNHKEEIEHYKKAAGLNPNCPRIYCNLGIAYWRSGKNKKAFAAFKQAVSISPDFALAHHWLTLVLDRLGRYPAIPSHDEETRKNRCLAHACYMLGNAYNEFGLHAAARQAFKEAVSAKPDFAGAYYQLGALHIKKLRNPKRAAKYLARAEKFFVTQNNLPRASLAHQILRPANESADKEKIAETWLKEGLRLQRLGRYQGAVDAYREAVHHKPRFPDALYNMGIAYGSLEDMGVPRIDKAIGALREAIRIKPDFIHAYTALGASYLKQNEIGDAITTLREAMEVDPRNHVVFYYLGLAYRASSQLEKAAEVLKQAVALKPDSLQANYSLAMAYFDMLRYPEACRTLEEAIRIKPDFADAHYMLGILYHGKIPDPEKSAFHLKKAEKLYLKLKDHQRAARVRQILADPPA
ncbi:MAG: tetratricopeptide repeat protein [Nitrospinales bacterium]